MNIVGLKIINEVVDTYGSPYLIAEDLLQNRLSQETIEGILKIFGIEDFYGEEPEVVLTTVLLNILESMEEEL